MYSSNVLLYLLELEESWVISWASCSVANDPEPRGVRGLAEDCTSAWCRAGASPQRSCLQD